MTSPPLQVWQRKCADTEVNAYTALKEFALEQDRNLKDGADTFMRKFISLQSWCQTHDSTNKALNDLMKFRSEVAANMHMLHPPVSISVK